MRTDLNKLSKIVKLFSGALVWTIGHLLILLLDYYLRLKMNPSLQGNEFGKGAVYSLPSHGIPELTEISLMIALGIMSLLMILWNLKGIEKKLSRILLFLFNVVISMILALYIQFSYVIGTGIDSL